MAGIENLQCLDQLLAEEMGAAFLVGQGCQGLDHRSLTGGTAVAALYPPQGDEEALLHLVLLFDLVEFSGVALHHHPPFVDA